MLSLCGILPIPPILFLHDRQALAHWLTAELRKQPGCSKCTVHSVYKPPNKDADGCNWQVGHVIGQDVSENTFREAFDKVVNMAKNQFNLF